MKRFRLEGEEIDPDPEQEQESIKMASVLMLLSHGDGARADSEASAELPLSRMFECKTCNRRFTSFQALGGHRASHKKPRLLSESRSSSGGSATKPKVHECSICGVEFSIGQALGGHMRRHRAMTAGLASGVVERKPEDRRRTLPFDLNLLPFENDSKSPSKLGLIRTEIVDKIPMVECLY